MATVLSDVGERALCRRIKDILDAATGESLLLDDAAPLPSHIGTHQAAWVTTDPAPIPNLVQRIGMGDYYHAGWLCVVKTLSDLAAVGATPLGIALAVEFPPQMLLTDFDRFFDGAGQCAKSHGTHIVGGNIKENAQGAHAVSFGVGNAPTGKWLPRGAASETDVVYVVDRDDLGAFWAGVATHMKAGMCHSLPAPAIARLRSCALTPRAKTSEAIMLLERAPPSFCMDSSDGLLCSAEELAHISHLDVLLKLDDAAFSEDVLATARAVGADHRTWAVGFGSCQLLCAAPEAGVSAAEAHGIPLARIGHMSKGPGCVVLAGPDGEEARLGSSALMRGEQFRKASFWQQGVARYIDLMLTVPLAHACLEG